MKKIKESQDNFKDNFKDGFETLREETLPVTDKVAEEILKDIMIILEGKYNIDFRSLDEKLEYYKKEMSADRFIWVAAVLKTREKERLSAFRKLKTSIKEICYFQKCVTPEL